MASGTGARGLLRDFQAFIMRGNVLDLAVAVIVGAAFNAVVSSFANDILLRLIGAIAGQPKFDNLYATLNKSQIAYGHFITVLVNFLIIAAAVFIMVRTFETLQERRRRGQLTPEQTPAPTDEAVLLAEIRDLLAAEAQRPPTATGPTTAG